MEDKDQYHHYIPRFLLRNFAVDNCERVFASSKNLLKKQHLLHKKKKPELLQTYNKTNNQLEVSLIAKTYGYENMYKDFNHEDTMHVEEKLAELERKASRTIRNILKASQVESEIVLLRKDLSNLRKFLFIMNYRNPHRWSQFTTKNFDFATLLIVEAFMRQHNLQHSREVWLQNIREILDTPHEDIKDNPRILLLDRDDYKQRMFYSFLVIWQAGENDEFVITNNGFGIFEGVNGCYQNGLRFQFAYHYFYVISPKLVLVLCHASFRKTIGPNPWAETLHKTMGYKHSILENAPHPPATPKYVATPKHVPSNEYGRSTDINPDTAFDSHLKSMGLERQENDMFTFPFVKIPSATVHLVNSILLNETKPDLVLTFFSRSYLYKTILKYHKSSICVEHDFSSLKNVLFVALNKTHEEDLHLRRNIPAGRTCNWNVRGIDLES